MLRRRLYSTQAAKEAWLYIDAVFPIQIARWDFRHSIGLIREENLLEDLHSKLDKLSNVQGFKALELKPHMKDGGVFVKFTYTPPEETTEDLDVLQLKLQKELKNKDPLPSWTGLDNSSLWLVKGSPWLEDLNRYASKILKITFDGPDLGEQQLYELCRPYGKIKDITPPSPVPAGTLRSTTLTYHRLHSATIARNVLHGLNVPTAGASTKLRAQYIVPIQAHAVRDWLSSHPKIVLPVIFFLLGTLTYTVRKTRSSLFIILTILQIFDPIRSLMVEAKMLDWFDYRKFRLYQWLRSHALDRLSTTFGVLESLPTQRPAYEDVWKERKDAEASIKAYLADMPATIAFVHGPQGSGKTSMLNTVLEESGRNTLIIDVRQLNNAGSDIGIVGSLAGQTGYWPVFTFLNSMNNLIDLASVGVIGQKTGMSTSVPDQIKQVLEVVTHALQAVSSTHRSTIQQSIAQQEKDRLRRASDARKHQSIIEGTYHDGRIDAISGNGIMSELGMGIERFGDDVRIRVPEEQLNGMDLPTQEEEMSLRLKKTQEETDAVKSLPIVVLRNYASAGGSPVKDEMLTVLASWAASLAENQIAHVIVLSDNRENAKRLAKALPSKPLNTIALSDADSTASLSFVKQKLHDVGNDVAISGQEAKSMERLGGRASDLESLIHKVRSGMSVDEAVEDIISRGVAELRKNAFGDDADDAKSLPWSREQAWRVLKVLSKAEEVGYHEILLEFPFKGDETALRSMEHAELIAIGTKDGRPTTIRPGKPVFRSVFERVVGDKVFEATQEIAYNEKQVVEAESKIKAYEAELATLTDTMEKERKMSWVWSFGSSACHARAKYIGKKLVVAERKVETLERKNDQLKKALHH
ncbi:RNA12 protein-domain-containing protein [Crepidotus variabilis]|uniref:Mitochondrial escape protein 2 n=1 Tax=Crepidotus variabilis TaxID=179855 RepID=A0A9P6JSW1_9AGAR|nr:RNA12 protein-domain-containing protein [Crepidotus variabilis]